MDKNVPIPGDDPVDDEFDVDAALAEFTAGTSAAKTARPAVKDPDADLADAIRRGASDLGIDPLDYAAVMSYESGGTFDPWKGGPVTKWGKHRGTIQYGEPQRKQYGVYQGQSAAEQITKSNVKYLRDRGVRPGMKLPQIYTAINGGRTDRKLSTPDVGTGRTIADNIRLVERDHLPAVRKRFGKYFQAAGGTDDDFDVDAALDEFLNGPRKGGTGPTDPTQAMQPATTGPVTELPQTLEAQRQAAMDPASTRVGVLYTDPTTAPPINLGEYDIPVANGQILRTNASKLMEYLQTTGTRIRDLMDGTADFTPLIGGKAEPTGEQYGTTGQVAVISYDEDGVELVADAITDPASIPVTAALHKKQFPGRKIRTEIVTGEDVVAGREQVPDTPPDDAAFDEANAYLASQGQPQLTREQFNDAQTNFTGTTSVTDVALTTPQAANAQEWETPPTSAAPAVSRRPNLVGSNRNLTNEELLRTDVEYVIDLTGAKKNKEQFAVQQGRQRLMEDFGLSPEQAALFVRKSKTPYTPEDKAVKIVINRGELADAVGIDKVLGDYQGEIRSYENTDEGLQRSIRNRERIDERNIIPAVDKAIDRSMSEDVDLTEKSAEAKIDELLKTPRYAGQRKAAEWLANPLNLFAPAGIYNAFGLDDEPSDEWNSSEKARLKQEYGSYKTAYEAERAYQNMDAVEMAVRVPVQFIRSFAKNVFSGTAKSAAFVSQMSEWANPANTVIKSLAKLGAVPEGMEIGLRNAGNSADYLLRLISSRDAQKAAAETEWVKGTDPIAKQQIFAAAQEFDKAIGDDEKLKGRFWGALADAGGSAAAFVALGAVMPSIATRNFWGVTREWSPALSGALQMTGPGYEEGVKPGSGLTENEARAYGVVQGVLGLSEMFGAGAELATFLKNPFLKGSLATGILQASKALGQKAAKTAFKEAKEEFAQEVFQTTAGNAVLEYLKDKNPSELKRLTAALNRLPKQLTTAVVNEGIIAAITGGLMGGATGTIQQVSEWVAGDVEGTPPPVNPRIFKDYSLSARKDFLEAVRKDLAAKAESGEITDEQADRGYGFAEKFVDGKLAVAEPAAAPAKTVEDPDAAMVPLTAEELQGQRPTRLVDAVEPKAGPKGIQISDKDGESYTVLEDRGDKGFLVEDAKGVQKVWPLRKFDKAGVAEVRNQMEQAGLKSVPVRLTNTQLAFDETQAKPIRQFRQNVIDPADLVSKEDAPKYAADPLNIDPHITIKYGLKTSDPNDVAHLFAGEDPIEVELGKTAVFPGAEGGNYDVIIAKVKGRKLQQMHDKIKANADVVPGAHKDYVPHVTLAYVKKGMGQKYANRTDLEGLKFTFDGVTFSPADRRARGLEKTVMPLKSKAGSSQQIAKFDNSLGIKRADMPQISSKDKEELLAFARERGVAITEETVRVGDLLPTQEEYNPQNAAQLPDKALEKPLMVSSDNRVLDGHNTFVRLRENPDRQIKILRVDQKAEDALETLGAFPKSFKKDVSQVGPVKAQIVSPIDRNATQEEKARQLMVMTEENKPIVTAILEKFRELGFTHADPLNKNNEKKFEEILGKANRPDVKAKKPWWDVEHIRDAFRFRAGFSKFEDVVTMAQIIKDAGIEFVEVDTEKFLDPSGWGWRPVPIDLRFPNGQLVEFYTSFSEMIDAQYSKGPDHPVGNHDLFEKWRNTTPEQKAAKNDEFLADMNASGSWYAQAYEAGLARAGFSLSDDAAIRASFMSMVRSLASVTSMKTSSISSAEGMPGNQTPKGERRIDGTPSADANNTNAAPRSGSDSLALPATDSSRARPTTIDVSSISAISTSSSSIADTQGNTKPLSSSEEAGLKKVDPAQTSALGVFSEKRVENKDRSARRAIEVITKHMNGGMQTPIKEATSSEVEDAFYRNALVDLDHWLANYKDGYVSFYGEDIAKANEMLQEWAKTAHGRELAPHEIDLFHLLGSLSASGVMPREDSALATLMLDRYLSDGTISALDPMRFRPEFVGGEPTGNIRFETDPATGKSVVGTSRYSTKVRPEPINTFVRVLDHFKGDLKKAMAWINSSHPLQELLDVSGQAQLPSHEYLDTKNGGKGVFSLFSGTGAKLGSYYLNRTGNLETVTKDMWYGRGEARYLGLPLANKDGKAIGGPVESNTVYGRRVRMAEDAAMKRLAKKFKTEPAVIQQWLWDFEQRLWEHAGMPATKPSYISTGVADGIERLGLRSAAGERSAATIGVGVVREGTGKTIADTVSKFAKKAYKEALATNDRIIKAFNVNTSGTQHKFTVLNLHQQQNTVGVWEGTSGSMEESVLYTLSGPTDLVKAFAVTSSILAPNPQQAVMLDTYDRNGEGDETHITFKDMAALEGFVADRAKYNAGNLSLNPTTKTVIIVHNRLDDNPLKLQELGNDYKESITNIENRAVETDFIDESRYRSSLQEARDSVQRHYPGKRGQSISAIIDEADARLRKAKPELYEEAPLKSVAPQTLTPEFKKWFRDSKVVDEKGNPLTVYHGTADDIAEFKPGALFRHGHGRQMRAVYFSPSPATASAYARTAANAKDATTEIDGSNVIPAFVSLQNPAEFTDVADFANANADELQRQGFDGAIRRNSDNEIIEIAAFRSNQIKSAIGNNGQFDANEDSILKRAKTTKSVQHRAELEIATTKAVLDRLRGGTLHENGELELNEADAELLRRLLAERYFQRTGEEIDELPFDGIVWSTNYLRNLAEFGRTTGREQLKAAGMTEAQLAKYDDLMNALDATADANEGYSIAYVYDTALPHERVHKEDRTAGGVSAENETKLLAMPIAQTKGTAFDRAYPHVNSTDKLSELVAIIASGEAGLYGLSTDVAAQQEFLRMWADAVIDNNAGTIDAIGFPAWAQAYPLISAMATQRGEQNAENNQSTENAAAESGQTQSTGPVSGTGVSGQTEESQEAVEGPSAGTQAGDQIGDAGQGLATDAEIASATGRTINEVRTQNRKFAQTLADNLMDVGAVEYEPQTVEGWKTGAAETIEERGVDAAIEEYHRLPAGTSEGRKTALGVAIAVELYTEGRTADLIEFGRTLTENIGNAAQELRAAALMSRLSPAFAGIHGDKVVMKAKHRVMTAAEREQIDTLARQLEEAADAHALAQAALAEAQGLNEKFDERIKELEKMLAESQKSPAPNADLQAELDKALKALEDYKQQSGPAAFKVKGPKALREARQKIEAEKPDLVALLQNYFPDIPLKLPAHHGTPHVFKAEILVEYKDGKREFIEGDVDKMPEVPKGAKVIKEFPHGRMKLAKVGTGEGHAAYGHGLYFASQEKIADWYREQLSRGVNVSYRGTPVDVRADYDDLPPQAMAIRNVAAMIANSDSRNEIPVEKMINGVRYGVQRRIDYAEELLKKGPLGPKMAAQYDHDLKMLDELNQLDPKAFVFAENKGARYNVDLKPSEDEYLDLDKGYTDQSPLVQKALGEPRKFIEQMGGKVDTFDFSAVPGSEKLDQRWRAEVKPFADSPYIYSGTGKTESAAIDNAMRKVNGHVIYNMLTRQAIKSLNYGKPSQEFASNWLLQKGIRGNRYLDGDSRHGGAGSYNYVIFNDRDVAIESVLKKVDPQTLTPGFKNWFKDSKVVDVDGNPLVVYHGSEVSEIETFETGEEVGRSEPGIFFTQDVETADFFASKDLLPNGKDRYDQQLFDAALQDEYEEYGDQGWMAQPTVYPVYLSLQNPKIGTAQEIDITDATEDINKAKAEGYDGLIVSGVNETGDNPSVTYVAFYPNQIKSAIGNNGDFNPDEGSILKSVASMDAPEMEQPNTPEFKAWFKDSKVVDEEGRPRKMAHATLGDFDEFTTAPPKARHESFAIHLGTTEQAVSMAATRGGKKKLRREGANIMPLYVSLQNPLRVSDYGDGKDPLSVMGQLIEAAEISRNHAAGQHPHYPGLGAAWLGTEPTKYTREEAEDLKSRLLGNRIGWGQSKTDVAFRNQVMRQIRDWVKGFGYDGLVYTNRYEGNPFKTGVFQDSYAVFDSSQLKSAIGNNGDFDPNEGSILKSTIPDDLNVPPDAIEALVKLGAAKLIDEVPTGLTPQQFDKWLNEITGGRLGPREVAVVHALAHDMTRPAYSPQDAAAKALAKNRLAHRQRADRVMLAEGMTDVTEEGIAAYKAAHTKQGPKKSEARWGPKAGPKRPTSFMAAVIDNGEQMGMSEETVAMALAMKVTSSERDLKKMFAAKFPDGDFAKAMNAGKQLLDLTKDQITHDKWEQKHGKDLTAKQINDVKNEIKLKATEERLKKKALERAFKALTEDTKDKFWGAVSSMYNVPRSVMFSGDLGFLLAQGLPTLLMHPTAWWKAVTTGMPAALTDKWFEQAITAAYETEMRKRLETGGVKFEQIGNVADFNDDFMSDIARHIPFVKQTNRMHSLTTDLFRLYGGAADLMELDKMYEAGKLGKTPEENALNYNRSKEFLTKKWVNVMSGKGYLGALDPLGKPLAQVGSAPRYTVSAFQIPYYANPLRAARLPKGARKIMMKNSAKLWIPIITMMAILSKLGLINDDPEDKDFLVIDMGKLSAHLRDLKINPLRAIKEPIRLAVGLPLKMLYYAYTGNEEGYKRIAKSYYAAFLVDSYGSIGSFWKSKLHPTLSTISQIYTGKNFVGEPLGWMDVLPLPLVFKEGYQAWTYDHKQSVLKTGADTGKFADNWQRIAATVLGSIVGFGANSYPASDTTTATKQLLSMKGPSDMGADEDSKLKMEQAQKANQIERLIREGEDVSEIVSAALATGQITKKQADQLARTLADDLGDVQKRFGMTFTEEEKAVLVNNRKALKILDYLYTDMKVDWRKIDAALKFTKPGENKLADREALAAAEAIVLEAVLRSDRIVGSGVTTDDMVKMYQGLSPRMDQHAKDQFLEKLEKKARSANKGGNLSPEELEKVKSVIPGLSIVPRPEGTSAPVYKVMEKGSVEKALADNSVKRWSTDDWVEVLRNAKLSEADRLLAEAALKKKAENARKSKTLTPDEVKGINSVMPNFKIRPDDSRGKSTTKKDD